MDKIKKFLKKLPGNELKKVLAVIERIEKGHFSGLDVKKLSGHNKIFRIRIGGVRVLFLQDKNTYRVISIERRNKKTHKV